MENNFNDIIAENADFSYSFILNLPFKNADLRNTSFEGSYLDGVDFENADLRNANFEGSYLSNVDFENADLSGADFTWSIIVNEKSDKTNKLTDAFLNAFFCFFSDFAIRRNSGFHYSSDIGDW